MGLFGALMNARQPSRLRDYLDCFLRVVAKHAEHAGLYRSNHPDCKLVFFVFDESTGYLEIPEGAEMPRHEPGNVVAGRPHFAFFDGSFVEAIRDSNADYFIWHAPFKFYRILADGFVMPDTAVYDVRRIPSETLEYDAHRMFSTES